MTLRSTIRLLLIAVLGLPLVQAILLWVAGLLKAMGDEPAAVVVSRLNTAVGVVWLIALVAMVVALALQAIEPPRSGDQNS
jgi:hypothetical protein